MSESREKGAPQLAERLYASLFRIRRAEEEIARIYPTDKIKSPVHLSIGQEAVAVGVCEALRPEDTVFGTYRGHAMYLAKGASMKRMFAELYGKATGCGKGKAGSMHLVETSRGVMGTSAVVGTTIPQAAGFACAMQYLGQERLTVSFFGEGACEEGVFHETVNFAVLKKLPLLFVCENNRYAIHAHQTARQPDDRIVERMRACGLPAERIEDNDVFRIYERTQALGDAIRSGGHGPAFLECMTYRWKEHVGPNWDWHLGYRDEAEAKPWMERDTLRLVGERLDAKARAVIEARIDAEIREAVEFAEQSPWPAPAELFTDVYKDA